jgi:beta-glucosidase/6-phospho-beta-glucosidase/beta-galactosidase
LQAASIWLFIASIGMRKILGWIRERYNNRPLIVTENGEVFQHQNVLMTKRKKKPKTKTQPTN